MEEYFKTADLNPRTYVLKNTAGQTSFRYKTNDYAIALWTECLQKRNGGKELPQDIQFLFRFYMRAVSEAVNDWFPVLMIVTSNAPDTYYTQLLENYRQTMNRLVGPTQVLVSGDTLQLKDYSKLDWPWTLFDPEAKKTRHETVFPQECKKAYDLGAALLK